MRLWSLHPQYLDRAGLTALWREGLLAQKVLHGGTRGYRNHPQLHRFRDTTHPEAAIAQYLREVVREAERRGYQFDGSKIAAHGDPVVLEVTSGQRDFEWAHLRNKLLRRAATLAQQHVAVVAPTLHPSFTLIDGAIAPWERP
jgi:hypothetical protein